MSKATLPKSYNINISIKELSTLNKVHNFYLYRIVVPLFVDGKDTYCRKVYIGTTTSPKERRHTHFKHCRGNSAQPVYVFANENGGLKDEYFIFETEPYFLTWKERLELERKEILKIPEPFRLNVVLPINTYEDKEKQSIKRKEKAKEKYIVQKEEKDKEMKEQFQVGTLFLKGQVPFGKKVEIINNIKVLVDDEEEMNTIKLIVELKNQKMSYLKICEVLTSKGIKNKRGNINWFPSQIQRYYKMFQERIDCV
jgi:hypothetical protein